jgi:hypothetical protein
MRELTRTEIEAVSGARRAPAPRVPVELRLAIARLREILFGTGNPPPRA